MTRRAAGVRGGDDLVVASDPAVARAVEALLQPTSTTHICLADPSSTESVVEAATIGRTIGSYRTVFVATSALTIASVMPAVDQLRDRLAVNHVPIALADHDVDIDVVWGHVFRGGLLDSRSGSFDGEPPLVDTIVALTARPTGLAPLRIVRSGATALLDALVADAATDHAFTVIDGADEADTSTAARALADRPLQVGSLAFLGAVLDARRCSGPHGALSEAGHRMGSQS